MKKLILILALILPAPVLATDLYVSTTGSDSANNCQVIGFPCATINYARVQGSVPRVVNLCIFACNGTGTGTFTEGIAAGNFSDSLTIQGYPGEIVTVNSATGFHMAGADSPRIRNLKLVTGSLFFSGTTNGLFEDLTIEGSEHDCIQSGNNSGDNDNNAFYRIVLIDCGQLDMVFALHGIYLSKTVAGADEHWLFDGLEISQVDTDFNSWAVHIYSGSTDNIGEVIIRRARIHGNTGSVLFSSCGGCRLENSLIYDNSASGPVLGPFGNSYAPGPGVFNTTIVGNTGHCFVWGSTDVTAQNNICRSNTGTNGFEAFGGGTLTQTNNICSSGCASSGDPLFTNEGANDYTLTEKSPALNTGVTLAAIPDDFNGVLRPQGSAYDLGALERTVIVGGGGSGNTRTSVATENCTGAAAALSTGYTQLSTVRTVNRDGSGKCTGSAFDDDPSAVVRSTGTFSATAQYAAVTVNNLGSATDGTSYVTAACFLSADQDGARDGYETFVWNIAGTINTVAYKWTNGTLAQLPGGGRTDIAWSNGDVLGQECTAGRVVVLKGATVLLDLADSSHTTGKPGFGANGDALIDDIDMGDLNVTPGTCTINIQQPSSGAIQFRPSTTTISWTSQHCTGNVTIQASWNGGTTWLPAFATVAFNSSPYTWDTVIGESATVKVRVCSGADCGTSENFTVHGQYVK